MYQYFACLLLLFQPSSGARVAKKGSNAAEGHVIEQWAKSVIGFSSQGETNSWHANQTIGEPDVYPEYGNIAGAWAQTVQDSNQFIELEFEQEVDLVSVEIYEVYKAGGVVAVKAIDMNGRLQSLWKSETGPALIENARIFTPRIETPCYDVKVIRLEVDCTAAATWVEIDAVKLIGKVPDACKYIAGEQWVDSIVDFSSQFNTDGYAAADVIGEPNVFPKYGDLPGTWAQKTIDDKQFIVVAFSEVMLDHIDIYETYNGGGVVAVKALNPDNSWTTLWESATGPTDIQTARIFTPPTQTPDFAVKQVRLEVNCTAAGTWVELDAIKIVSGGVHRHTCENVVGEQWVESVVDFSSQYDTEGYSAADVIGEPNVFPKYGDFRGAWGPNITDENQFIVVEFSQVMLDHIDIYETYNGGAVVAVKALNPDNSWTTLWKSARRPKAVQTARIFTPPIETPDFAVKQVRLDVDCTAASDWIELDAIKIVSKGNYRSTCNCKSDKQGLDYRGTLSTTKKGYTCQQWSAQTPHSHDKNDEDKFHRAVYNKLNYCRNPDENPKGPWCYTTDPELRSDYCDIALCGDPCLPVIREQWVKSVVSYSSQGVTSSSMADQVIGEPNVYPRNGDILGAWAQTTADDQQYIEVEFEKEVNVTSVDIYETLNGGAVVAVKALTPDNDMVTLWESDSGPTVLNTTRIFSPPIKEPDFPVNVIRLDVDCTAAGTWAQIDAIQLFGVYSDPVCVCKTTKKGLDYKGQQTKTISGYTCQRWDAQYPWRHDKNDVSKYPNAVNNEANYCRNPNERFGGPWCYTTDLYTQQEYCTIPMCLSERN